MLCCDVQKAFTRADIDRDVYIEMPEWCRIPGKVFKLNKALEGHKQSGHLWQQAAFAQMRKQQGVQSLIDPSIWNVGKVIVAF